METSRIEVLQGALVGTAVGDSLGLPYEGMSRRRVRRMVGGRRLRHRFALGRGMVSDDTDHACLVALALLRAQGDSQVFARVLARSLRWWLAGLPAGVGLGTLRAILKLWVGFGADRSGVWSAGNGPAMRAPIIGAYASGDRALREELVRASTRVTHADPKAEQGARAVAAVAAYACGCGGELDATAVLARACDEVDDEELRGRLLVARDMVGRPTHEVVRRWDLGEGITGYIYDTVPAVLHCWTRHRGAIEPALQEIVECGGDTDTTGAILGGLAGATHGVGGIPEDWRGGIVAWPRSVSWMTRLGEALATGAKAPRYFLPGTLLRNAAFLIAVYGQIVRRAFPPY